MTLGGVYEFKILNLKKWLILKRTTSLIPFAPTHKKIPLQDNTLLNFTLCQGIEHKDFSVGSLI